MMVLLMMGATIWGIIALCSIIRSTKFCRASVPAAAKFGTFLMCADDPDRLRAQVPALLREADQVIVGALNDDCAQIAASLGATAIRTDSPDPHTLAAVAAEASSSDWWVMLDSDLEVLPGFGASLRQIGDRIGSKKPVINGSVSTVLGTALLRFCRDWLLVGLSCFNRRPWNTRYHFMMWRSARYFELRSSPEQIAPGHAYTGMAIHRGTMSKEWRELNQIDGRGLLSEVAQGVGFLGLAALIFLSAGTTLWIVTVLAIVVSGLAVLLGTNPRMAWLAALTPLAVAIIAVSRFTIAVQRVSTPVSARTSL